MTQSLDRSDLSLEKIVLKLLFEKTDIREMILPHLTGDLFNDPNHKKVVKIITEFVTNYGKFPRFSDIKLLIEEEGQLETVRNVVGIDLTQYTEEFLLDEVTQFLRRKMLWVELVKWVELMKERKGLDSINVDKVLEAKNFSFKNDVGTELKRDDGSELFEELHRKDVYVPTGFIEFDDIMAGGFYKKAMTMFIAGTNCFDGKEVILVKKGNFEYKREIQDLFMVYDGYKVKTPEGHWVPIKDMVKKVDVEKIKLTFSDGHSRIVAKTHRFMGLDGCELFAKDAEEIKTISGSLKVIGKEEVPDGDVYDIMIDDPHWYTDQYGVIHHNTGKTLFKCSFASECLKRGQSVLFITLEMPEARIKDRIVCNLLDKTKTELKQFTKEELISRYSAMKRKISKDLVIKEYGEHELTASKLAVYLKDLGERRKFKPDIVFIDYMGLVSANTISKDANGASQLKRSSEEFHAVAKKMDFALVTSMQFNRQGFKKADPDMAEISESFATLFTADEVLLITQTAEMQTSRRYKYKKVKSRTPGKGRGGNFFVNYDKMRLTEVSDETAVTEETSVVNGESKFSELVERKAEEIERTGEFSLTEDEIRDTMSSVRDGSFDLDVII